MNEGDVLNSADVVPSFIDASSLVAKRLNQISDLVDVIRHGGRDHNPRTVIQRLPKHMRRRAMSHNIKRLPRKDRKFAKSSVAQSNHRKKPPSRFRRRRSNNLQKEYTKRQNNGTRWLQTHIWHAKRFEMIKLWNYKIPLRCYQRGIRPFLKAARDGVVMFDHSYYHMLRLRFNSVAKFEIFNENYKYLRNAKCSSLLKVPLSASGVQQLFSTQIKREADQTYYDVILSVHPLFFNYPLKVLSELTDLTFVELDDDAIKNKTEKEYGTNLPMKAFDSPDCLVTDESNLYSMFTFYGADAIPRLYRRLKLVKNTELKSDNLSNIHSRWKSFCQHNGCVNDLPDSTCFTLLAEDPRLSSVEETKEEECESDQLPIQNGTEVSQANILFDHHILRKYLSASISEERLNQLKSTRIGGIKLKHYKIPVALSFWNWCSTNHIKLILPANAARDFFSYFYRCGFRVGALSDQFLLCREIADCAYPFLWLPLKLSKPLYRWKRYHKFSKTTSGYFGKWDNFDRWSHVIDNPNMLAYLQSVTYCPGAPFKDSELLSLDDVLIPVRVLTFGKGGLTDDTLIYEWKANLNVEQLDSNGVGILPNEDDADKFFDPNLTNTEMICKGLSDYYQEKRSHVKRFFDEPPIIGRVVIAEHSQYRGRVEALGYMDFKWFLNLRNTNRQVCVRNPNSVNFVEAIVDAFYTP